MDVVITVHNPEQIHLDCIQSLIDNSDAVDKIIIVNNASTQIEYIEKIERLVTKVISLQEQVSIGQSWNIGIDRTDTDFVVISNDDILFTRDWLLPIQETMEQYKNIGILQPYNTLGKKPEYFPNNYIKSKLIGDIPLHNFIGCCFAIRKSMLNKLKIFDSEHFSDWDDYTYFCDKYYPFGPEDQDFYKRVREIGLVTSTHFGSYVHHYTGQTMSKIKNFESIKQRGNKIFHERWSHGKI